MHIIEKPIKPLSNKSVIHFNWTMHCYVSPQLNVLVQHHVNTSVYFGKPAKNGATHRYKVSMPFPTSVPMRHSTQYFIYQCCIYEY